MLFLILFFSLTPLLIWFIPRIPSLLEIMKYCLITKKQLLAGFINVILREIQDNLPSLLDSALRMLLQLLGQWKAALSDGPGDIKVRNITAFLKYKSCMYQAFAAILHL